MKKYFFVFALLITFFNLSAQNKKKPVPHSPVPVRHNLNSITDSLSYSIGIMVAHFYKQQGITKINDTLVNQAIRDEMTGGKTLLNETQCNQLVMNYIEKAKTDKASVAKKEGLAF